LAVGTLGTVELSTGPALPSYPLPTGISWDIHVQVSYGLQPGGPGTEVMQLVKLTGPNPDGTFSATQTGTSGPAQFQVDLPTGVTASLPGKALTVSVDNALRTSAPASPYVYVETQAYKRHHTVLQIH